MPLAQLNGDIVKFSIDIAPYTVAASLPVVVGFAAGYLSPTYRENTLRSAGKIMLLFLALTMLIGVYSLVYYITQQDPYWPDLVGFVALYGFLLIVFVSVYTLASSAVGLKTGAYAKTRKTQG